MIKLESGRSIDLEMLRQEKTYAALLEGLPRRSLNDRIIERWRRRAEEDEGQRAVVIPPVRKPSPKSRFVDADERLDLAEYLPSIVCLAMFQSEPVRQERLDFSLLNIVWFQDAFATPIDPSVIEEI